MQYRWLLVVLALAMLFGGALTGASPAAGAENGSDPDASAPPSERLVSPHEGPGHLWPYTSRSQSAADRTLALNVLVRGDAERVRRALEDRTDANWSTVEGEGTVAEPAWTAARGSARYTYVAAEPGASGQWVEPAYQLGVGTYLGQRTHLRAYPSHVGNWTAIQAHTEYWDWFRLRHTVTGVEAGARFVERDLRDEPVVDDVSREYHGLDGGGTDGWITVVNLVPGALAAGVLVGAVLPATARRRWSVAESVLPVALAAVVLGVRSAGVAAELLLPALDPHLIAALCYPVLVAGPPLVIWQLAHERPPVRAALLAAGGFGAGLVLDLGTVSVSVVPVRLVLHRLTLVVALAVLAGGVAGGDRRTTAVGLLAWVAALAAALFGVI